MRVAAAWLLIGPAFLVYYATLSLLVVVLLLSSGLFRLILGTDPSVFNCVFWAGWQWLCRSWADWRSGAKPPGGYLVIRWSAWGPFLHFGWVPALEMLAYVPPQHKRRWLPPPLFCGRVEKGE